MPKTLIIEPDLDLLTQMSSTLEQEGFKTSGSTTSTQGLDIARILKPDLIILDKELAAEDNYQLLSILRNDSSTASARIIVTTNQQIESSDSNRELSSIVEGKSAKEVKKLNTYIDALKAIWADKIINPEEEIYLQNKAQILGLTPDECLQIESAIMGFPKELALGLENGADAYILKPGDFNSFKAIIYGQVAKQKELHGVEDTVNRLIEILEGSVDIVTVIDADLENLYYLNQHGRDLLNIQSNRELHLQGLDKNDPKAKENMLIFKDSLPHWSLKLIHDIGIPHAKKHGSWRGETAIISCDGKEIPISQVIQAHKDINGSVDYFSSIMRDITEIKKTSEELSFKEQELRKTNQRFNKLATNVPGVIFQMSLSKGKTIEFPYMSPTCDSFFNVSADKTRENPKTILNLIHPEDAEEFYVTMNESAKHLTDWYWEGRIILNEDTRWLHCIAKPEELLDGMILWDGILTDSTGRKRAEKERDFMEIQLRHAQKMESIGQLAAGVAHEINTPVQYVGDNIRFIGDYFDEIKALLNQLLLLHENTCKGEISEKLIKSISKSIKNSDLEFLLEEIPLAIKQSLEGVSSVSRIVQSMKDFSHPGTSKKIQVDLNNIIASTITVSRNEWKYVAEMEKDFDNHLPQVCCLPDEFNQVILNLILNACHAIQEKEGENSSNLGKISVKTYQKDQYAVVEVTDTGIGIPPEIQSKVFDPFFTTKKVGKGTGQGLAIVHSVITDKHAGTVTFNTIPGSGSTFIVKIPIDPKEKTVNT